MLTPERKAELRHEWVIAAFGTGRTYYGTSEEREYLELLELEDTNPPKFVPLDWMAM